MFGADGQALTSDSALCPRGRDEVEADLAAQGYVARDAPDRPGLESVLVARRHAR